MMVSYQVILWACWIIQMGMFAELWSLIQIDNQKSINLSKMLQIIGKLRLDAILSATALIKTATHIRKTGESLYQWSITLETGWQQLITLISKAFWSLHNRVNIWQTCDVQAANKVEASQSMGMDFMDVNIDSNIHA